MRFSSTPEASMLRREKASGPRIEVPIAAS
jgi:hypothetical protein